MANDDSYQEKRKLSQTPEPGADTELAEIRPDSRLRYVLQKHDAENLHYDLRLEHNGSLLSWAVPKGPSAKPQTKRLAVKVEDHPIAYGRFEGSIPDDQYGGGTVMVWDAGWWEPEDDVTQSLRKGKLSFRLGGERLKGKWALVRRGSKDKGDDEWLLVKSKDQHAANKASQPLSSHSRSVLSRRTMKQIAKAKPGKRRIQASRLPRAKKRKRLPKTLSPQLATLKDEPPEGENWIHETKYDGYRLLARCGKRKTRLITRNGKDWSDKFPEIAEAFETLELENCIVDGELIAVGKDGVSDFQTLQNAQRRSSGQSKSKADVRFVAFDLPYAFSVDLRKTPLLKRKFLLAALLGCPSKDAPIQYSDHSYASGADAFEQARSLKLEGIICKDADSPYASKRNARWQKAKCENRQELVICGFTEPQGSRSGFGSLHLAYYADDELRYAGKVGTGFDDDTLKTLRKKLARRKRKSCPLSQRPKLDSKTTWVRPDLVAEVKFAEQTNDGLLRQAAFLGLRKDKNAKDVRWEGSRASAPDAETENNDS